jgi:hypothetical protein
MVLLTSGSNDEDTPMSFQAPMSVKEVLGGIHTKEYLLPAIQREFVWDGDQIRRLVDSLMREYPIGSFLLWKVEPETAHGYVFYDFLTDYHAKNNPYATKAVVPPGRSVLAILDGQQRLTALNIAVYGSLAVKKPYAWWANPDAFPKKRLHLNLLSTPDPDELALAYDLRFLTDDEAERSEAESKVWYPVGDIITEQAGPAMLKAIHARGITDAADVELAHERLWQLYNAFHNAKPINYFLEASQNADKVLDIFVRVNSGGTTLSYSDLLLSMATNQWQHLDAREVVRTLVTEMNTAGNRQFAFSKDVVLKTALMVGGVDLRFRVTNFTAQNMKKVEAAWEDTERALLNAAALLASFGLTEHSLTASSVIIPLAYYLARRELGTSYLESAKDAVDRTDIRGWVIRSLVKRGIWGSALDSLLGRLRRVVDEHGGNHFPVAELEAEMVSLGKSLAFEATEIDELLQLKYQGQGTFPVLALLYPGLDFSKSFHEDHIFPKSRFTAKRLAEAGVPGEDIQAYIDAVNLLPNLQLLSGVKNAEKLATLPEQWIDGAFPNNAQRDTYLRENDLNNVPLDLGSFLAFFDQRRARIRQRLLNLLGATPVEES